MISSLYASGEETIQSIQLVVDFTEHKSSALSLRLGSPSH